MFAEPRLFYLLLPAETTAVLFSAVSLL